MLGLLIGALVVIPSGVLYLMDRAFRVQEIAELREIERLNAELARREGETKER
jgi:hypothetical protein